MNLVEKRFRLDRAPQQKLFKDLAVIHLVPDSLHQLKRAQLELPQLHVLEYVDSELSDEIKRVQDLGRQLVCLDHAHCVESFLQREKPGQQGQGVRYVSRVIVPLRQELEELFSVRLLFPLAAL